MKSRKFIVFAFIVIIVIALLAVSQTALPAKAFHALDKTDDQTVSELIKQVEDGKRNFVTFKLNARERNYLVDRIIDDPDIFWIDLKYRTFSLGRYSFLFFKDKYVNVAEKQNTVTVQLDRVAEKIMESASGEYDRVLACHDWVCSNLSYDEVNNNGDQDVYGALLYGKARCAGYAKIFTLLLERVGISSEVISGLAIDSDGNRLPHAWNLVYIEGKPYYFDVTWDDTAGDVYCYNWFGVTSQEFNQNHIPSYGYEHVAATDRDACYYIRNGMYMEKYSINFLASQMKKQNNPFYIKCADKEVYDKTIKCIGDESELMKLMKLNGIQKITGVSYAADEAVLCIKIEIKK